ncbi:peroxidase-like [Musca vetustissima]|uniref:peroxidase-like n=1 Tax=Musca vetustissima TaxID=27455 RepID=UPI002AB72A58|nr:peroxidase-like [Musca vetustissima]
MGSLQLHIVEGSFDVKARSQCVTEGLHILLDTPYSDQQFYSSLLSNDVGNYNELPPKFNPYSNNVWNSAKPVPEESLSFAKSVLSGNTNGYDVTVNEDSDLNSLLEVNNKLECAVPPLSCVNDSSALYYRNFDGSCNNLGRPGYGMANSRYGRILKPRYGDGKYAPSKSRSGAALPNPRELSLSLHGDDTVMDNTRSMLTMQWGQVVAHDMSEMMEGESVDCCKNPNSKYCYSIPLNAHGPIALTSGKTCLNFARSLSDADVTCPQSNYGYIEKLSKATPFLDLSSVYGNSYEQNIKIRQYFGGYLKTIVNKQQHYLPLTGTTNGECPASMGQCYSTPDVRNQLTPTIAVMQTIFVREHNRIANILGQLNPHYSDEKLFQEARKINIAQYQKITYYDWLPWLLGPVYSYSNGLIYNVDPYQHVNDYDPSWNPVAYAENSAGAFRYAHNQIPGWFSLVTSDRAHNKTLRLSDYFKRPGVVQLLQAGRNFDDLVRGLITQLQKRADANLDKEIKHYFDRKLFDEFGTDLKSIDIQRGRDFGLASYNDYREWCGLPRAHDWSGFANEIGEEKISLLQKFYKTPDDVELNVGGSLEQHHSEAIFGPTFQCIMGRQFLTARKADRFFFEHHDVNTGFTKEQLAEIRKVNLAAILCANTETLRCVQPNVFLFPNEDNNLIPCSSLPQLNLNLWKDQRSYY